MGYDNVRGAITTWLQRSIADLRVIFRSVPIRIDAKQVFSTGAGADHGFVAVVHIPDSEEHLETVPRVGGGWKRITYKPEIYLLFRQSPTTVKAGDRDPIERGQRTLDNAVDAVKARLRQDPTLGNRVFSAGLGGEQQEADLRVIAGIPIVDDGAVHTWTRIDTVVTEWLQT